jgi:tetratricopeptide (TPR) repeat protein
MCNRADCVEPIMLTEVVRAATWRRIGQPRQAAAAFQRALAMEPDNWSLYLDLADLQAEEGDFAGAVQSAVEGLKHGPNEITLRAAETAYRARHTGDARAFEALISLAPQMPNSPYRAVLIDHACVGEGLSPELLAQALRLR